MRITDEKIDIAHRGPSARLDKLSGNRRKRPMVFVLSPRLTERMREICAGKQPDALLFTNSKGGMLDPDNLVKSILKPVFIP